MVRDPVCGTDVNPETTNWVANHEGLDYYFCSESCQRAFVNTPSRFIVSGMAGHGDHSGHGGHAGGCCGEGAGNGWMRYVHLAIMVLYLILIIFR